MTKPTRSGNDPLVIWQYLRRRQRRHPLNKSWPTWWIEEMQEGPLLQEDCRNESGERTDAHVG